MELESTKRHKLGKAKKVTDTPSWTLTYIPFADGQAVKTPTRPKTAAVRRRAAPISGVTPPLDYNSGTLRAGFSI